jgi:lipoprotein-releasing system permease protein
MGTTGFLLRRSLIPHEGSLLTLALWISVAGVALGIVQLMVVLSVMSGFQKFLRESYTRISSEMVVVPRAEHSEDTDIAERVLQVKAVEAVTPFSFGQAMILKDGVGGVTLEGIDLTLSPKVVPWDDIWQEPPLDDVQARNPHWIWLGSQLAAKLHVKIGDKVKVFIPGAKTSTFDFVVTGTTKFGIYDHDLRYAYISLGVLKEIFYPEQLLTMYKTRVSPNANLDDVVAAVEKSVGEAAYVRRWSDINRNLFLAVQHQKWMLFSVLEIIIALAAMNVVNLLMMSAHHRRRDIAILRAMGMRISEVFTFFVVQGAVVGLVGIGLGITFGYLACHLVGYLQPALLSEKVYNVTKLPIHVQVGDVIWIAVGALGVCLVFSVVPALRAAYARPVTALRYES